MFQNKTIVRQQARSLVWLNAVIALLLALVAVIFIPMSYQQPVLWFGGAFILSFILLYFSFGFSSWITVDKAGEFTLCLKDNSSRANSYLPFAYIRHVEIVPYKLFHTTTPEVYRQREYHNTFTHLGYVGNGLIIVYQLPKHISGDDEERSWQIPAPKAEEFLLLLNEHAEFLMPDKQE